MGKGQHMILRLVTPSLSPPIDFATLYNAFSRAARDRVVEG